MADALFLAAAILSEVIGTTSLKLSEGFTQLVPSIAVVVFYGLSFFFLSQSLKGIPIGISYAVWSGVGTALIAAIGYFWFQEPMSLAKIGSIVLIIVGVVGLNLSGSAH